MMSYFNFKGNIYCSGTVVKIYDDKINKFNFSRYLKFSQFDENENKYKFHYINNCFEKYSLSEDELKVYIESIVTAYAPSLPKESNVESKDIDGIIPAWTWFVLALIGSLFIQGIANKILIQVIAICLFTAWRENKKKGE